MTNLQQKKNITHFQMIHIITDFSSHWSINISTVSFLYAIFQYFPKTSLSKERASYFTSLGLKSILIFYSK